jgi:anti-anti-sigma factor
VPPLALRETSLGDVTRIDAEGGLDAYTCEQLSRAFEALFRLKRFKVLLGLEKIEFLSSAGAGAVIAAMADARAKGGDVVVLKPSEPARSVFLALGAFTLLKTADTKEAALALFATPGRKP